MIIRKKIPIIVSLIIASYILGIIVMKEYPVKLAKFTSTPSIDKETISELHGNVEIECKFTQSTGPQWLILSCNGKKLFPQTQEENYINIKGDILFDSLCDELKMQTFRENIFVVRGNIIKDGPGKILIVDSWDIKFPIFRDSIRPFSSFFYLSKPDFVKYES
ncbi:MAG TPA: hypothetical protein VF941_22260 [Clostridia bacterium]